MVATMEKWKLDNDQMLNTKTWLECVEALLTRSGAAETLVKPSLMAQETCKPAYLKLQGSIQD